MATSVRKTANASSSLRVQNTTAEQTAKSSAGILQRIVATNLNAAAQTITVKDNTTTLIVLKLAANESKFFEFGCSFSTSLKITNSAVEVDALIIFD